MIPNAASDNLHFRSNEASDKLKEYSLAQLSAVFWQYMGNIRGLKYDKICLYETLLSVGSCSGPSIHAFLVIYFNSMYVLCASTVRNLGMHNF
jgi:hypothetical protein